MTEYDVQCQDYKKKYEEGHRVCDGGIDPEYEDPDTGSNRRPRCPVRDECRSHTNARLRAQNLIPAENLTRRYGPPPVLGTEERPTRWMMGPRQEAPLERTWRPTTPAPVRNEERPAPAPLRTMGPSGWVREQQAQQTPYYIPPYVTVAEEGGSTIGNFGASVFRAGVKGLLHQAAHFFDVTPLGRKR